MEQKHSPEEIKETLSKVLDLSCLYLQHAYNIHNEIYQKKQEDLTEAERLKFVHIQTLMASLCDIIKKSDPVCYELFPSYKDNLDRIFKLYDQFEKAGYYKVPEDKKEEVEQEDKKAS